MINTNEKHAELGYRTLLAHAQHVGIGSSATDMEEIIVDLLTSLMHLQQDYGYNIDNMVSMSKERFKALTKCPQCSGEADRGIDNCIPSCAYMCSKCRAQEDAEKAVSTPKMA